MSGFDQRTVSISTARHIKLEINEDRPGGENGSDGQEDVLFGRAKGGNRFTARSRKEDSSTKERGNSSLVSGARLKTDTKVSVSFLHSLLKRRGP